ncbi:thiamine-binding protein [Haloarculaceae archaeon H-GB2-1]|nr:thiamine-binding protein [Haloarculaceae archaeon H-GB1-1]MEA5389348.1 thiamine-binding protein [Haloarculaceae archaeon H-GB11]MEA5409853.1 thiamine-binding protein [Haloarculaceae archaeon H-GB2-1]
MTAIARLEVIPVHEGSQSNDIANAIDALDDYDVAYETTATDTVVEAETVDELFDAVKAAHNAVGGDRVITELEIDHQRSRDQHIGDRVAAVETALGRPARREDRASSPSK